MGFALVGGRPLPPCPHCGHNADVFCPSMGRLRFSATTGAMIGVTPSGIGNPQCVHCTKQRDDLVFAQTTDNSVYLIAKRGTSE